MINANNSTTKSTRLRKVKTTKTTRVTRDFSNRELSNNQEILNGVIQSKQNDTALDDSWNIMDYSDYMDYRKNKPSESTLETSRANTPSYEDAEQKPGFIFKYYKRFGFYWNVFPKTDYCYLPGSPNFQKEVSPGIPTVPNLSRHPISSYIRRGAGSSYIRSNFSSGSRVEFSNTSFTSSTHNTALSKRNGSSIEARQNLINSNLRNHQSLWMKIKRVSQTTVTIIKQVFLSTYTSISHVSSSAVSSVTNRQSGLPVILLLLFFLSLLYFLTPRADKSSLENTSYLFSSQGNHFLSWLVGCFLSVYNLVKESLLFIPTICLQLAALFSFNNTSSIKSETLCLDAPAQNMPAPPFPIVNYSNEFSEKALLAMQTEIVEKLKSELAGKNDHITSWIEQLQHQMVVLAEDLKKMNTHLEGEWKSRFDRLEEDLAGLKKAVLDTRRGDEVVASPSARMVERAVAKYHADRTGKPDYALQSSGGYVVRVRCTQTYTKTTAKFYLLGLPLPWDVFNGPETIIKPGVMPGECWAFEGSFAQVTLHLATKVKVTGFSLEHSPKELALHGHISSAPKQFSVWALKSENDEDPFLLGRFTFLDNGESLQQFDANEYDQNISLIELKIESNHGHPEYTCLYRFRVHGLPPPHSEVGVNETLRPQLAATSALNSAAQHTKPYR